MASKKEENTSAKKDQNKPQKTQYAGFWVRAAAIIIDVITIQIGLGLVIYFLHSLISGQNFDWGFGQKPSLVNNSGVILFILATIFFVTRFGATPGKIFYGLKIITAKNKYPSIGKTLLREIVGKSLSFIFFLGYIWAAFDKEKQSFHDKIAETHVIVTKPIDGFKKFTIFALAFLLPMIPVFIVIILLTLFVIKPLGIL